jgi:Ca2+-binding RTX toxin-like protein
MALKVSFGNGGNSQQYALKESDPNYVGDELGLNGGSVATENSGSDVGPVVDGSSIPVGTVAVPNGASGTGGSVDVGYNTESNAFEFDVAGAWNSVKNVLAESDTAANIVLNDFVHADVYFGGSGNSSVEIHNVKRGNVTTGSGNDSVEVSLSTNDSGWQNTFNVDSGAGNDSITFMAGDKTGIAKTIDGRHTTVTIDAGAGNDTIDLSDLNLKLANITGGAGNDELTGSAGMDVYNYGAGGNGRDYITNFDLGTDHVQLNDGLTLLASGFDIDGNLQIKLSDASVITFQDVTTFDASIFA